MGKQALFHKLTTRTLHQPDCDKATTRLEYWILLIRLSLRRGLSRGVTSALPVSPFFVTCLHSTKMNAPDRFELFLLGDDEKKIEEKVYSGMSNTSDFILKKEDHTLGNLLSEHLKAHPHVYMAGYKSQHPHTMPCCFISDIISRSPECT